MEANSTLWKTLIIIYLRGITSSQRMYSRYLKVLEETSTLPKWPDHVDTDMKSLKHLNLSVVDKRRGKGLNSATDERTWVWTFSFDTKDTAQSRRRHFYHLRHYARWIHRWQVCRLSVHRDGKVLERRIRSRLRIKVATIHRACVRANHGVIYC